MTRLRLVLIAVFLACTAAAAAQYVWRLKPDGPTTWEPRFPGDTYFGIPAPEYTKTIRGMSETIRRMEGDAPPKGYLYRPESPNLYDFDTVELGMHVGEMIVTAKTPSFVEFSGKIKVDAEYEDTSLSKDKSELKGVYATRLSAQSAMLVPDDGDGQHRWFIGDVFPDEQGTVGLLNVDIVRLVVNKDGTETVTLDPDHKEKVYNVRRWDTFETYFKDCENLFAVTDICPVHRCNFSGCQFWESSCTPSCEGRNID